MMIQHGPFRSSTEVQEEIRLVSLYFEERSLTGGIVRNEHVDHSTKKNKETSVTSAKKGWELTCEYERPLFGTRRSYEFHFWAQSSRHQQIQSQERLLETKEKIQSLKEATTTSDEVSEFIHQNLTGQHMIT